MFVFTDTEKVANLIDTKEEAQAVIAELISKFAGETAQTRINDQARFAHQSKEEVLKRTAGNLLTSFVNRKPGGYVAGDGIVDW